MFIMAIQRPGGTMEKKPGEVSSLLVVVGG